LAVVTSSTTVSAAPATSLRNTVSASIAFRETLIPFAVSRILFLVITLVVMALRGLQAIPGATEPVTNTLAGYWDRWDAIWYLHIATNGYSAAHDLHYHVSLAFFPLYPLALHLWLILWPWSPAAGALVLSNLCFIGAACTLFQLTALDFGRQWAGRAVWVLALFPTGLFFFAGYSESIFLLCALRCAYHLRMRQWWQAGLWGGLAAATRPMGIVLIGPFLIAWWQSTGRGFPLQPKALFRAALLRARRYPERVAAGAAIPGGLLAYMAYLGLRFGNPLAFSSSQRSWHRGWALPWESLYLSVTRPLSQVGHLDGPTIHAMSDTLWALLFLAVSIPATRALPRTYGCYLWLFWLEVLSTPALLDGVPSPLISVPRFLATAFPLVIFLAGTRRRFATFSILAVPFLIVNTVIFLSGGWVA
jgi:Gpi18-like mannosyltransferase